MALVQNYLFLLTAILMGGFICVSFSQRTGTLRVRNNCGQRLLIQNHGCNIGDFTLEHGQSRTFSANYGAVPPPRIWANRCDSQNNCETRGGNGQQSLAELNWNANNGESFYDVSFVDAYNVPITMSPFQPGDPAECTRISCKAINRSYCPGNPIRRNGRILSCVNPNRDAQTSYSNYLNTVCPDVYAWSRDDLRRPSPQRFKCRRNSGYEIVFC